MPETVLKEQLERLFEEQQSSWPELRGTYASLSVSSRRHVSLPGGSEVVVQYNPLRLRSAAASLDAAAVAGRQCFLCPEGQPLQQMAHEWREFKVQVNPYPIFSRHFTISHREHLPQQLDGPGARRMMELAGELPGYFVFFNGAECGASAPDHLHFQAGVQSELPLCNKLFDTPISPIEAGGGLTWGVANLLGSCFFAIVGEMPWEVTSCYEAIASSVLSLSLRPWFNVVAWRSDDGRCCMTVHLRVSHRASSYGHGSGELLVSPAACELAGMWAVPREQDFSSINSQKILEILREVTASPEQIFEVVQRLC